MELIRRFPAVVITHGFLRMRPVRSLQIPPESGICPTDFTDFSSSGFFCHADFADDADFFHRGFLFIGWHGINSEVSCWGDYSRIFAEATYSVVADTPWDQTKRFIRDSIKKSVKICEICWTKNSHEEKSAPYAKSAWQNNSSIFRAPAIGQRPNIRENPWVIR